MKINTASIEGYADMTPEEKIAALEAFEYEDANEEIDKYKKAVSKANSEAAENKRKAAEWKTKHDSLLSDEEKKQQEANDLQEKMQKELEELRKEKTISGLKAQFLALGYDEALAGESAQAMADGKTDVVFENSKKFIAAHDKTFKASLMDDTPGPKSGGEKHKTLTSEQFDEMSYEELAKFKAENPDAYDAFMKGD